MLRTRSKNSVNNSCKGAIGMQTAVELQADVISVHLSKRQMILSCL